MAALATAKERRDEGQEEGAHGADEEGTPGDAHEGQEGAVLTTLRMQQRTRPGIAVPAAFS
jgi:hypothetical protein